MKKCVLILAVIILLLVVNNNMTTDAINRCTKNHTKEYCEKGLR